MSSARASSSAATRVAISRSKPPSRPGGVFHLIALYAHVPFQLSPSLFIFICRHRFVSHSFSCKTIWGPVGTLPGTCRARGGPSVVRVIAAKSCRHRLFLQRLRVRTTKASCTWNRPKFVCGIFFSLCHTHTPTLLYCTPEHSNIHDAHTRLS